MAVMTDGPSDLARRREAEIAGGALPLFLEKGFHGTSIREIAAAAGLSMGGLYEYISSKDDVLSLVYRQMTSPFAETLDLPSDGDLTDLIASALTASWDRAKDVQILYRETVALDAGHRDELAATERAYAARIAQAIEAGIGRGELTCANPLLAGHVVMFLAAFMPLRSWITRADGIESSADTARAVAELIVTGLRA
jgi:TetR/AcrR family transcriptional regulator, cholesterol catabolism regulator